MKGRNEDTSASETDTSMVILPSQKLKSWKKLRLEGKIGKWTKAQRMAARQINSGLAMTSAASLSVSQAESFFVQVSNTAMKINGIIAGDSATGRKPSVLLLNG